MKRNLYPNYLWQTGSDLTVSLFRAIAKNYNAYLPHMILEVAILHIISGKQLDFENSFKQAQRIISSMRGYISHELQKCMENEHQYILLVKWERLEDHTIGFRNSYEYQEWKARLHHFYDPFPTVEHYQVV